MVAVFREKSSVSVFWLIALSVVLHGNFIIVPPQVVIHDNDGWIRFLLLPLTALPSILIVLLYHAFVIVQALRISAVLNNLRMFPKLYFIPALCYLLLTSLYPAWGNITAPLLLNFVIIWLFSLMATMYGSSKSKPLLYNTGLLTGSLALLYPPCLFLVPAAFFALTLLRVFRLNEWMILLFGILTPAYLLASVLFLNDNLALFLTSLPQFRWHLLTGNQIPLLIAAVAGGVLIIFGTIAWQANTGRMIVQTRRCWSVLALLFFFSLPLLFGLRGEDAVPLLLGLFPAAALASNTFVYSKNELLQNILFWTLIVVIIFNNWYWLKT